MSQAVSSSIAKILKLAPNARITWSVPALAAAILCAPPEGRAQDTHESGPALEEVLVTATKQGEAEAVQDVALAITAWNAEQLEGHFTKDLQSLSYTMPNVSLDDIGTVKGTANLTIRGLGINSSIPSIDPTVGVFVDGMYLGIAGGVVFDLFDLEGVEVLRGPQGLLFGRNVTGGAVLIKTRKPTDALSGNFKVSTTDGLDTVVGGSISGPLSESVNARMTAYYNQDEGWFTNLADGKDFGASRTVLLRPSLSWTPTDTSELIVRYEHGDIDGDDGTPSQNRALFDRHSFDFSVNYDGYNEVKWDQAIAEFNIGVPFGDGVITNILGWRDYASDGGADIDGTTNTAFHARFKTIQDQLSNELRYAGRFGRVKLTAGLYWFTQDLTYIENRILAGGAIDSTYGGEQDQDTYGAFAQTDIDLTNRLVLALGARYSKEEKDARIATFVPSTANSACNFDLETCRVFNFIDSKEWSDTSPKVGLQWRISDDAQLYSFWTKGFRSGGYNLRSTSTTVAPGPTDPEEQKSMELGAKVDWLDGRLRTNLAVFHNKISDMQREVNLASPGVAVLQIIRNTADATIQGVEIEAEAVITSALRLTANLGYTDGEYDSIRFDISGDGIIDARDFALDIPRLAPLTWGVGMMNETDIGASTVTTRINFSHRDAAAFTDNNLGTLNAADMLDASIGVTLLENRLDLSLFGRNLLDEVTEGNDTQLPNTTTFGGIGATYSPLNKGRSYGLELKYRL